MNQDIVDRVALALCAYTPPDFVAGDPCREPCSFCLGQAEVAIAVVIGEISNDKQPAAINRVAH